MSEPLRATLIDSVVWLKQQVVPYALIGGLAALLRGQPRLTVDVDLVIAVDIERSVYGFDESEIPVVDTSNPYVARFVSYFKLAARGRN